MEKSRLAETCSLQVLFQVKDCGRIIDVTSWFDFPVKSNTNKNLSSVFHLHPTIFKMVHLISYAFIIKKNITKTLFGSSGGTGIYRAAFCLFSFTEKCTPKSHEKTIIFIHVSLR